MAPFEASARRAPRRPPAAMAMAVASASASASATSSSSSSSSASSSLRRPHNKQTPPRPCPPHRTMPTNQDMDDDDDLELPIVHTKPLSVADSIEKFHRVRIVGVNSGDADFHTRRPHSLHRKRSSSVASTASSASTLSASSLSSASSSSSISAPSPSPFTTPTRSRSHQRPKHHGAVKQLLRQNRLSSLVLHSVTPRDALPTSSSSSASLSSSSPSYTEYDVVVENVRTSQIWQVARRFSRFVQFRKELTALFATPHCHHCTAMYAKLDALHDAFPAKRLWGSNRHSVTAQRARKLQLYLDGLLALADKSHTKQCRLISASFAMHVRGFLTVEGTRFHGIPGGDLGHAIPSLLQELSRVNTGAVVSSNGKRLPLATILEQSSPSSAASTRTAPWEPSSIAMLEKDEDDETEDEEDESPNGRSQSNQHSRP